MATKILVDLDSTQTLTNKTLTAPTLTAAVVALASAPSGVLDAATKGYVDGLNINPLNNASLSASVATNQLTVSLKTTAGSTPSASDPVRVTFRSATDADGSLVTRTVTGATTLTFASGSSLGMVNAKAARLWVGLLDNAGTVEVCAWNPLTDATLSLLAFTPNTDVTSTAEGSGTATSAQVLYSTNARSAVPFVLLGFVEITEATAGVWATAPTVVQTFRDGYRKTGDIVQQIRAVTSTMATGTTTLPFDDTIPQSSEGDQFMTLAVTPRNTINLLQIEMVGQFAQSGAGISTVMALFQDATAGALAAVSQINAVNYTFTLRLVHLVSAGTTSATTFKMRAGGTGGVTVTFNGAVGARLLGGVCISSMQITEILV